MKNKLTLILLLVLSVSLFATVSESKDINLSLALDVPDSISIKVESADGTYSDLGKTVLLEYYKNNDSEVYSKSFLIDVSTVTSSNVSISLRSEGPLTYKDDYIDYDLNLYHSEPSQSSDGKLKLNKDNYTSGVEYYRLETNGVITQSNVKGLFYVTIPRSDVVMHFGGVYQTKLIVEMKTIE